MSPVDKYPNALPTTNEVTLGGFRIMIVPPKYSTKVTKVPFWKKILTLGIAKETVELVADSETIPDGTVVFDNEHRVAYMSSNMFMKVKREQLKNG